MRTVLDRANRGGVRGFQDARRANRIVSRPGPRGELLEQLGLVDLVGLWLAADAGAQRDARATAQMLPKLFQA